MQRLAPRLVPYWIVANIITAMVLTALIIAGVVLLSENQPQHAGWLRWAGIGAGGFLFAFAVLQPALAYAFWRYAIDDELLIARYGILFREEKTIPISRLQHVDLRRGPIERMFDLSTLVVFTAGTEGATFRLPGLEAQRAQELRDRILAARGDDVL